MMEQILDIGCEECGFRYTALVKGCQEIPSGCPRCGSQLGTVMQTMKVETALPEVQKRFNKRADRGK